MVTRHLSCFDPVKIARSGQAFRFQVIDQDHVELVAKGRYLQIARLSEDEFAFSATEEEFHTIWADYFDLDRDYQSLSKRIDKHDDYLKEAERFGRGIRILKQDVFETTISYIISQRRSIPSITTSVERISGLTGKVIKAPKLNKPFVRPLKEKYYAFPTPDELSRLTVEDITNTGVGYRAPYIAEAVRGFTSGKLSEKALDDLSDEDLYKALTSMYGVGAKVANCIMLFAFARTNRFPIDVWIQRILDRYYKGSFKTELYPDTAGIMQQFMFYYERNGQTD